MRLVQKATKWVQSTDAGGEYSVAGLMSITVAISSHTSHFNIIKDMESSSAVFKAMLLHYLSILSIQRSPEICECFYFILLLIVWFFASTLGHDLIEPPVLMKIFIIKAKSPDKINTFIYISNMCQQLLWTFDCYYI